MTEKRFTEIVSTQKVVDNQTGKEYDGLIDDELLKIFNKLAENNELLKKENEQLKSSIDEICSEIEEKTMTKTEIQVKLMNIIDKVEE